MGHHKDTPHSLYDLYKAFENILMFADISQFNRKYLIHHIFIYDFLLKCNKNSPFLERMITDKEEWIAYNNVEGKRLWTK